VDVWVPVVPIGITKVPRRTVVAARKSKTESLSSGNQDGGLSLSVRMLGQCAQEKSYRFCFSFVSLFLVSRRLELLLKLSSTHCVSAALFHEGIGYRRSRGS
jgi:hypothetical protein